MKRFWIILSLALLVGICGQSADASAAKRKPRKKARKTIVEPAPQAVEPADTVKVEAVPVQDTVAKAEEVVPTYSTMLNIELTPAQMDSLVAQWNEEQNARAFDEFFSNFISFDTNEESASEIPDSVYIERLRALVSPVQLPYNPIVKSYIARYTDTRWGTINRILSRSQYYFPIIEDELIKAGLPVELRLCQ